MWPEVSVMEIKTPGASRWCEAMWPNWRHYELRLVCTQDPGHSCITSARSAQPRTLDQDLFLAAAWAWPGPALGRGHINMMTVIKLTLFFSTLAHISILTLAMFEECPKW